MRLQKILNRLQKLHPKEIDLSLARIKNLCSKLGDPQKNLKCITVVGTNGKYSTIQCIKSILKSSKINFNIYTSPHLQKINERFIFNNKEIDDDDLSDLLLDVEKINKGEKITFFEFLTAAFFLGAKNYPNNINLIEAGLFHRFDATNILKKNLASVITSIGIDHVDWLPKNKKNIKQIIFEKTSSLLNSKIIISKQENITTTNMIKKSLKKNKSKKIFFNDLFSYSLNKKGFFNYKDEYGKLKLPLPKLNGDFQLSNISAAIATLRNIKDIKITKKNIKDGISKIKIKARLQEIKSGKLKSLCKKNKLYLDGSHNPLGAKVLSDYLNTIKSNKHIIIGMMSNKDHLGYLNFFKNKIISITTVDIANQPNSIKGKDLKKKISSFYQVKYKSSIEKALKSLKLGNNDVVLITGSLYLAGQALNLN